MGTKGTEAPSLTVTVATLAMVRALWMVVSTWVLAGRAFKLADTIREHLDVDDLDGVVRACLVYLSEPGVPQSESARKAVLVLMTAATVGRSIRDGAFAPREAEPEATSATATATPPTEPPVVIKLRGALFDDDCDDEGVS